MLPTQLNLESSIALQTNASPSYGENEYSMLTPMGMNTLLLSPGEWLSSRARANTTQGASSGYFGPSHPDIHTSNMGYSMNKGMRRMNSGFSLSRRMQEDLNDEVPTYDGFVHSGPLDTTTPPPPPPPPRRPQATTQPTFTSLNAAKPFEFPPDYTIEPSQTQIPPLSHSSSNSSGASTVALSPKIKSPSSSSSVDKRRRTSADSSCDSARAIYLEKNRKAASKCRGKQKRQQEDLVERAREVERKNKALKVEVEILKSDMRDLMEVVGQHTSCKDGRMRAYVEREAEKLLPLAQVQEYTVMKENNGLKI